MTQLQVKESKWLVKCFLNYLRHDKNEVNVLFDVLSIFLFRSRIDYTFLKKFYIIEVFIMKLSVHSRLHHIYFLLLVRYLSCPL